MLGATLESLTKQITSDPFEVIVVNNASTDRTREVAQQYQGKLNLVVVDEPHKGRGAARAAGFDHAQGGIVFSTDADVIIPPHWLSSLLAHLSDKSFAAVSGTCQVRDLSQLGNSTINTIQSVAMRAFARVYGTPWLTGSNFAIRKEVYQVSGGFDHKLTAFEDAELALRVKAHGRIKMITDTPVVASGRRFAHHGLFKGIFSYVRLLNVYHFHNQHVTLDDPR